MRAVGIRQYSFKLEGRHAQRTRSSAKELPRDSSYEWGPLVPFPCLRAGQLLTKDTWYKRCLSALMNS